MDELSAQKLLTDFVFDKAKPPGSSTLESLEAGRNALCLGRKWQNACFAHGGYWCPNAPRFIALECIIT